MIRWFGVPEVVGWSSWFIYRPPLRYTRSPALALALAVGREQAFGPFKGVVPSQLAQDDVPLELTQYVPVNERSEVNKTEIHKTNAFKLKVVIWSLIMKDRNLDILKNITLK